MKKPTFRALLLLLALLTVIPLAACQEAPTPQETDPVTDPVETDPATDPAETDPTETEPAEDGPALPNKNYGNKEFLIVIRDDHRMLGELYVESLGSTPTSVERAVYQRLSDISTEFGVIFDTHIVSSSTADVSANVKTGQDVYDLVVDSARTTFTNAAAGYYYDWKDLPYVDLEADWWSQDAHQQFVTPGGKLFVAIGDISYMSVGSAHALWFNKDLVADVDGLASPYDVVREKNWTFDVFEEYVVTLNSNLSGGDGSGTISGDTFGYSGYGWGVGIQMLYSTGCKILEWKNDDWSFPLKKDIASEALFDLRELLYNSGSAILSSHGPGKTAFADRRVAFIDGEVNDATEFAGLDLNYGILPFPMYRKSVREYYTIVDGGTNLYGVMRNTSEENAERISVVVEALAYKGHEDVLPLYYDTVLSYQALKDEDSIEMLHIIHDSLIWDLGYFYSDACNVFRDCVIDPESGSLLKAVEELEETTRIHLYEKWNSLDFEEEE